MVALYSLTIFTSAALLFAVQPMFARMVLPLLGGSPAAWNTAMVFYQTALLAGYAYAHVSTVRLGLRRQALVHFLVILGPLAVLPIALPAGAQPPAEGEPSFWLVGLMAGAVGLPLFALSATSPLLQKWFAATGHPRAADPYFLYVASNAGSMLALLAYPFLIEPQLQLAEQSRWWAWGYALLVVLMSGCGAVLWHAWRMSPASPATDAGPKPPGKDRARWVLLAFVPSSLLLGTTTYLSSEVAVVPLLWIIPLTLYLLTFILAFARRQLVPRVLLARILPILTVSLVLVMNLQATEPMGLLMLLHLLAFFVAAWLCHGELAAIRPAAGHLTEFYLWLSVGGVLGGVFNALVAPLVFDSLAEYPLALVLACLVGLPRGSRADVRRSWFWLLALVGGTIAFVLLARTWQKPHVAAFVFGLPALLAYFFSRHPGRFALAVAGLLVAGGLWEGETGRVLHAERSFFGVNRVTLDLQGHRHLLLHGKTLHGQQSLDPARRGEPLAYYHRTGPIGQVLALYGQDPDANIAFVGLGAGSLAAYARPGQTWTSYEIDPVVTKFAQDERYFTFLRDAAVKVRLVLGDARLSLSAEKGESFDVLVVDAYSSDAIPVHLVTREALAVYQSRLARDGVLAFHISNLHLELEPVFANLARDAGLACLVRDDTAISSEEAAQGKSPSIWLVMARQPADLAKLNSDPRWRPARGNNQAVWTDDYSSLLRVFRWR